jgi:hypothetical protein
VDDRLRRRLTRLLVILMLITALWGAWVMAKNGGRRGRIGIPTSENKVTQVIESKHFMLFIPYFSATGRWGIAV